MDPRHSAQDVHRCDLCETAMIYSYCDFCHTKLCKPCIGDHISDGYDKHKIVPFQQRRSTLIYPKCVEHPHKSCDLQCKNCNMFVCTFCMGSKQHKGHGILVLDDVYKTKKENIKKDEDDLQNLISPIYEEMADDLETQISNLDKSYENLTNEISKQGETLHKEIDIVISEMKNEVGEIKMKHRDILQKHLDEIKEIQSLIQQVLQTLKETDESNEISTAIEYTSKNNEFSKHPNKVKVSRPKFIPNPIVNEKLHSLFGHITPLSTEMGQNVLLPKKQTKTSIGELLDQPELAVNVHVEQSLDFMLRNVAYVNDEKIWTSGETGEIKCFNIEGLLLHTTWTKSREFPNDIAVDGNGDLIYSDWSTKSINAVKNWQTEELIRLQGWNPVNLCVTSTGDLLVNMYSDDETQSKIVHYSGSTEKQTIQFDDEGKPLYSGNSYLKHITDNRNHDICVADYEAGVVVVVNQNGKLRWRYTGHPSVTKNKPFKPLGITRDSQSRILTADIDNHCIHILDQDGQFLRYIDNCNLKDPMGLCVDKGSLFVCEYSLGNVKKIIYSN